MLRRTMERPGWGSVGKLRLYLQKTFVNSVKPLGQGGIAEKWEFSEGYGHPLSTGNNI